MSDQIEHAEAGLDQRVRRGLAWGALNNVVVRFAGLGVGIVLARLLTPEDFGVFAVAITVQLILVTLAELGISTDLIRNGDIDRRGPTVATIGLGAGFAMSGLMVLLAPPVATLLGSSQATPVVQVMSLTLALAGLSVVPYARMQREFMQSRQLVIDASSLVLSTAVTVALIYFLDFGPMSLALGRIAGQCLTTVLQFRFTRTLPRFGWDPAIARQVLKFGLPIAAANLLSWVIINVDNMFIGHLLGAVSLGFYVLAFNLSSWPMNAVGLTIRTVALPAFARLDHDVTALRRAFVTSTALTSALAAPLGLLLIIFAHPVVLFLYGERWAPAAPVLQALGAFGIIRVVFDLFASFLYSRGHSRAVLVTQIAWLVALAPAMAIGINLGGLVGAGWSHVVIGVGVLLPAYLICLRLDGSAVGSLVAKIGWAVLATIPASVAGYFVGRLFDRPVLILLAGCSAFLIVYVATTFAWLRRLVTRLRSQPAPLDVDLLENVETSLPPR